MTSLLLPCAMVPWAPAVPLLLLGTLLLSGARSHVASSINCTTVSYSSVSGPQAPGSHNWPSTVATSDACAKLCWSNPSCAAYHYYASPDPAAGSCYAHGAPSTLLQGPLNDGRTRVAGMCVGERSTVLPNLCHLQKNGFAWRGYGDTAHSGGVLHLAGSRGGCDEVEMWSNGTGAGGAFKSGAPIAIRPGATYTVTLELKTEGLVPVPNSEGCIEYAFDAPSTSFHAVGTSMMAADADSQGNATAVHARQANEKNRKKAFSCMGAYLTGGPYVEYVDMDGRADGWFPAFGTHAPATSDWHQVTLTFSAPTTAVSANIYLALAAHSYAYDPDRMNGGQATGRAWMRNVSIQATGTNATVLPPTISVPDPDLTAALELTARCMHNSQLSGNFTVGSEYTISGNLSPDLAFGLLGARRMAHPEYMRIWEQTWLLNRALIRPNGQFGFFQRIMAQVLWPLGVDALFSFSGNVTYLEENLPFVDKSLAFLHGCANNVGSHDDLPCFNESFMQQYPPGADWVDWQETRAYGSTTNFQTWYVRTLRRFSALHREFAGTFGNATTADLYDTRAMSVVSSVRSILWSGDHFATNARFSADCSPRVMDDDVWVDDQLWAVFYGVADSSQHAAIWAWLEARPEFELVPTRWSNKTGNARYEETWFGRLGAGDILMRYHTPNPNTNATDLERGFQLLKRIARAFESHKNVYESYTMQGTIGGDAGTDYLEHCGGFNWAMLDGPFGVDFDSDADAAATIQPQINPAWLCCGAAPPTALFYLRGVLVNVTVTATGLTVTGTGGARQVRVRLIDGGTSRIVTLPA